MFARTKLKEENESGDYGMDILEKDQDLVAAKSQNTREMISQESEGDMDDEASQGCCTKFKRGVRAIWATSMTEDTGKDRELYIKTTLRELIIYVIFLVILMILAFGMTKSTMFYYTKVLTELFVETRDSGSDVTFNSITSIDDLWVYLKGPLMSGLYWDTWYNNRSVDTNIKNYIYFENKLLGVPRIRQVKVKSDSCEVASSFKNVIEDCYSSYSSDGEYKGTFGPGNSTAWIYQDPSATHAESYDGTVNSYGGGGFYTDLNLTREGSIEIINHLFDNLWIARGTRAVFVDFTVYNANINLFCVIKLAVELPATGGALPSYQMLTVKLLRYVTPMDYFVLTCECIFICFIFYYIIEEIIEIKKHKWSYFKSFWNILDIVVIVISLVCAGFNIYRTVEVQKKLESLLKNDNSYPDFEFLSYWQQRFNHAVAVTLFFAWVKIFKYISFNKTMTQLSSTLGRSAKDLAGFAVMFFFVFFAFAQSGYLLFGSQVQDFRGFNHAVFTLFRIILGDFDFYQLYKANSVLGPAFFMLYVFFVFFVLINMFLAIINDSYTEVKTELTIQKSEFQMTDYFRQRANQVMEKMRHRRDKILDIQDAIRNADVNNDRCLDFEEWRNELKTRGYADGEIEAVFAKYDLDGDRILDEREQRRMQSELEGQKAALTQEMNDGKPFDSMSNGSNESDNEKSMKKAQSTLDQEEFHQLEKRVDVMEEVVGEIVGKIDAVLDKMQSLEMNKIKHRQTMNKILETISGAGGETEEIRRGTLEHMIREEIARLNLESDSNQSRPATQERRIFSPH